MKTLTWILLVFYGFFSSIIPGTPTKSVVTDPAPVADPYAMIREGQALLKEGDLVVRLNRDPTSRYIKNFNREDKSYSHAGLVLFDNGYPFIYHMVNGEENPDEKLRKDSLQMFCSPRNNLAYGIYRYQWKEGEIKKLKALIHNWYAKELQFDRVFDLGTDDKMYCSEMISKALGIVTQNRILAGTTELTRAEAGLIATYMHLPFSYMNGLRIVSIDNLYKIPSCGLIKKYCY